LAREKDNARIHLLEDKLSKRDSDIESRKCTILELEDKYKDLSSKIEELRKDLIEKELSLENKETVIADFKSTIEELNKELSDLKTRSEADQNEVSFHY
jgi:chromosome segregation ATPase